MSHTTHTILCGSCKSPAEAVPDPKADDYVTCSRCGRKDRFDHVMRSVKDYVQHRMAQGIHDSLAKGLGSSNFIKLTSQRPSNRSFRWITTDLGI
jgi:DNA-directed RNA polymerase subunit RPC12/RpoP